MTLGDMKYIQCFELLLSALQPGYLLESLRHCAAYGSAVFIVSNIILTLQLRKRSEQTRADQCEQGDTDPVRVVKMETGSVGETCSLLLGPCNSPGSLSDILGLRRGLASSIHPVLRLSMML